MNLLVLALLVAQPASLRVEVRAEDKPIANAAVVVAAAAHVTNEDGIVVIPVAPGEHAIEVTREGYTTLSKTVTVAAGATAHVIFDLEPEAHHEEEITVSATRTGGLVDDQPMRVEVLPREEIEEKMMMTPGDIVMMLNEMGGLRVQATSPSLGAAAVRVQGMHGRYTRFLSDGLPLFGEQSGGLGIVQISPMDLGQVEVIKGGASALYGAGAMGGIVNLVSKRPGDERRGELLLNQSTRGGTDGVFWLEQPMGENRGLTLLAGIHNQREHDVDDDAWADLPGYVRGIVRPRLFWNTGAGSFFATVGATWEDRDGGTMGGGVPSQIGSEYHEGLNTRRYDGGFVAQVPVRSGALFSVRASASRMSHAHAFGDVTERDVHHVLFSEATMRGAAGRHLWVAGAALERDAFRPRDLPQFEHTFTVPGVFAQDDVRVSSWLTASASGRIDHHSRYGWFASPRLSALVKHGVWSMRVSGGTGFYAPSVLTEETEAAGLSRLRVDGPLRAERGRTASLDLTRRAGGLSTTVTLFGSRVKNALVTDRDSEYVLRNEAEATTTSGVELNTSYRTGGLWIVGSYAHVRAREGSGAARAASPLVPRHSFGAEAMWEVEGRGRLGLELYYTGEQRLEANPFAEASEPYWIFGILAERRFGRARVFINGENLTDTRQTKMQPLLRPSRAADGRWTVDAWAPLEGRTINGGVRIGF